MCKAIELKEGVLFFHMTVDVLSNYMCLFAQHTSLNEHICLCSHDIGNYTNYIGWGTVNHPSVSMVLDRNRADLSLF